MRVMSRRSLMRAVSAFVRCFALATSSRTCVASPFESCRWMRSSCSWIAVTGVRISWLAMLKNSLRCRSNARSWVMSWKTETAATISPSRRAYRGGGLLETLPAPDEVGHVRRVVDDAVDLSGDVLRRNDRGVVPAFDQRPVRQADRARHLVCEERLVGLVDPLEDRAMVGVRIDGAEGFTDDVLLSHAELLQLARARHRVHELLPSKEANPRGRVLERVAQTESLGLDVHVRARQTPAEVPADRERDHETDERENAGGAPELVRHRERSRRRLGKDDDPTRDRRRRERYEGIASLQVLRDERAGLPGETLDDLRTRMNVGRVFLFAARPDELLPVPVDDPQFDRWRRHDAAELLVDLVELQRSGEHTPCAVVVDDRHREDDGLGLEIAARDDDRADSGAARDRGLEVIAVGDAHRVRRRGEARDVEAIGAG